MKTIYVLLFLGIILLPFLFNNANASIQIDHSNDYVTATDGNLVPYKLTQNSTTIIIETQQGSYAISKTTGALSFYNSTYIQGHAPTIPFDSYAVKAELNGTTTWNPVNVINNATPTIQISNDINSITVSVTKSVVGAGTFQVNYTKLPDMALKETFKAVNNNPAWTNYHIGMTQSLALPKYVNLGNTTYDLSQFNGTVLTRSWINSHNAQMIKVFNNIHFDMGLGWNHVNDIVIHYIHGQASIDIDYTFNTPILQPGQSIIIDPSIVKDTSTTCTTDAATTCAITIGVNNNRLLIVNLHEREPGSAINPEATAVKIGTTSFTKLKTQSGTGSSSSTVAEVWYLTSTAGLGTGAQTVTITWASPPTDSTIGLLSLYNVNQATPINLSNVNATNGTASTRPHIETTVTPGFSNSWIVAMGQNQNTMTGPSNTAVYTNLADASGNVLSAAQYNSSPTSGNKTKLTWNPNGSASFGYSVIGFEVESKINAPNIPTLQAVNRINSTAIQIFWNSTSGATGYQLNFTSPNGGTFSQAVNQSGTSYIKTGLTPGTQYQFKVFAWNSTGISGASNLKSNYTSTTAPTSPTISTITSGSALLSWTNGSGNQTGGFKAFIVTALGSNYTTAFTTSNSTSHGTLSGLASNREYTAKVLSRFGTGSNNSGTSSNSTTVSFYTVPKHPTISVINPQPLTAHIIITPFSDNGTVLGYKVEQSLNNSTWTVLTADTGNSTGTYDKVEPSAGTYYFRVSTIKYGGTSSPSNIYSIFIAAEFTVIGHKADNSTIVVGNVYQYNSTSSANIFPLIYGNATMEGLSHNQNFSLQDSSTTFITGKKYNINATAFRYVTIAGDDYIVDCPFTVGSTQDIEVFDANETLGHRITLASAPSCLANDTVTWHVYFKANGNSAGIYGTTVRVKVLNNTFGTNPTSFTANGTTVPTAYAAPWIISNNMTVGSGLKDIGIYFRMNLAINPAFTPINFTAGGLNVTGSNPNTLPILISSTKPNSSSTLVTFTYPNTMNLAVTSRFTLSNSTVVTTGLPQTVVDAAHVSSSILYKNNTNDIITIKAVDLNSGTNANYSIAQNMGSIPLVTQINNFTNGTYGTYGKLGVLDLVTIFVIILSMIGMNRVNETLGLVFNIMVIGAASTFNIISFPTVMIPAIALILLVTVGSTKKLAYS